jgi:hypothetical protein
MNDRPLVCDGGEVKALGDGRVGGYLVRFGDPSTADCQGDYFCPPGETYYGKAMKAGADVMYHHGVGRIDALATELGNAIIGDADISVKADGLWVEATINDTRVYAKAEKGELGWSSGSVTRMVKREPMKAGAMKVTAWPIIEATLTPRPVDPRNRAVAIKALPDDPPDAGTLVGRTEALVASAEEVVALYRKAADQRQTEGRFLSMAKRDALKALRDSVAALCDASAPRPDPERAERLRRRLNGTG